MNRRRFFSSVFGASVGGVVCAILGIEAQPKTFKGILGVINASAPAGNPLWGILSNEGTLRPITADMLMKATFHAKKQKLQGPAKTDTR